MSTHKTKEQALRDLGEVVAEEVAIIRTLTVREAAERIWYPGGPSMEQLIERCAGTGLCKPDLEAPAADVTRDESAHATGAQRSNLPSEFPPVMSPKTLAAFLEVTPLTLQRWRNAKTGPVPALVPDSNVIRYTREDVVAWLARHRADWSDS
ncbi:helix-turn-helix domain-containing protein [Microbacterium sp. 13-71-7]|uniref:helix-turn-helix domain-containing protein n=1 Tax=Microbacterium sp. 13-71-7 TaxID=1970399 RepID=UPI000BCD6E70|nr:helix-turn-helix domain-containing protein [Microbacterium sp. 13-71-7]OZB81474.1 MAG: hypothetical protein B7X32_16675 [Microbacterium sp. 13-71-7]